MFISTAHYRLLVSKKGNAEFARSLLRPNINVEVAIQMGLKEVEKKVTKRLQEKLKTGHFNVAQLVYNMNKLAGNSLFILLLRLWGVISVFHPSSHLPALFS